MLIFNRFVKSTYFALIFLFGLGMSVSGQNRELTELKNRGEIYISFISNNDLNINNIGRFISIDKILNGTVFAYCNEKGFSQFLKYQIPYQLLPHPGTLIQDNKMFTLGEKSAMMWDSYPTYPVFLSMMDTFSVNHPDICETIEVGRTVQDRKLLAVKISDHADKDEAEPRVWLSSSMHGDETTGFVTLLRFIDYLIQNYNVDPDITYLINHTEIWIMPLENPDGTYRLGNNNVVNCTRYNANSVDLNRNYKSILSGDHPDGEEWQPETKAMMALYDSLHFSLSANFHGGAEVVNYPFDSWTSTEKTHADDAWWQTLSKEYVDSARRTASSYMKDVSSTGYTNGGDWYVVDGSRQDYMTYFTRGREMTIEVSTTKLMPTANLPTYWNRNYRSILHYLETVHQGIQGFVTDSLTGEPLEALVSINYHDRDHSDVYSEKDSGDYCRPIAAGTYSVSCSKQGYITKTISNVSVNAKSTTLLNFKMVKDPNSLVNQEYLSGLKIEQHPGLLLISQNEKSNQSNRIELIDMNGRILNKGEFLGSTFIDTKSFVDGIYVIKVLTDEKTYIKKVFINTRL